MERAMNEEVKELPKPILIEDLGTKFATEGSKHKRRFGLYKCGFCGTKFKARTSSVKFGDIKSCGCYKKQAPTKHNLVGTKLYNVWRTLKGRVLNPKNKSYSYYGRRGITICEEWLDVQNFYNWAMTNGYSDGLSIDRIDNDGNYEPNNCRWTTQTIQTRNQRIYKNNKSGYRGVYFSKNQGKYKAQIRVNKIHIHLGYFQTAVEGAIVFNNYIIENNLEGFILNEIPEEYLTQNTKEGN